MRVAGGELKRRRVPSLAVSAPFRLGQPKTAEAVGFCRYPAERRWGIGAKMRAARAAARQDFG